MKIKINSGIYAIINLKCSRSKMYVGSASDFKKRWIAHRSALRQNRHSNKKLQNAWNKYGEDSFSFYILERVFKPNLNEREQFWINSTDCFKSGYNGRQIADRPLGHKHSEETKIKMSLSQKGREITAIHRKRLSEANKGKKLSEETRRKMSLAHAGRIYLTGIFKHSEETKRKISTRLKGNKFALGYRHTEETKQKLSASFKGVNHPLFGKHHSEESKRKNSESHKGKFMGDLNPAKRIEVRKKISEKQKERWERIKQLKEAK